MRRPIVKGKFIYKNGEKLYLKGATYGTFQPLEDGSQFPEPDQVKEDLTMMADSGFNCIRTYTVPPKYLLNIASSLDIHVMVGLPWEQHVTFLEDKKVADNIIKRVKKEVQNCDAHQAILCYTIGNEIPSGIVRWHGKSKIERFLRRLYTAVKEIDPEGLVTYVNYPTTEYLDLSFLDFDCFNIYLETPEKLSAYISRLHNLSGDRPLVLAEIGLDSHRNGEDRQAEILSWQVKTIFAKGCAGIFIFSWTDEWWRGGFEIEDWDFGLVDRNREPKPALEAVTSAFESIPYNSNESLPFISVVVCTYNGASTIRDTLEGLLKLDYPRYEVIVINDGSKDNTAGIVKNYPVRLINSVNEGLSAARNKGMLHARGEIIAYTDDDAYPDPQWLTYLAQAFTTSDHACIGGPNIAPEGDGFLATCVANAPGGPVHVLLNDEIAEHVPGCNMSFRKDALMHINGFDPIFRTAGDDVDVCWRIQKAGGTIGFHPSALVWHHRRNSFKAYWNQQKGYGKAEALLEAKWPEKYNSFGHLEWAGRIYGNGLTKPIPTKKKKIFHGTWGTSLFQSVYQPANGFLSHIPLMPEWYLAIFTFFIGGLLGFIWSPLLWSWLLFSISFSLVLMQAAISAMYTPSLSTEQRNDGGYMVLIFLLHVIQPLARLYGRFVHGLTPWRRRGELNIKSLVIKPKSFCYWPHQWKPAEEWLALIESNLYSMKTRMRRGGEFDRWDFQVSNGMFSKARGLLTIEEHGAQRQCIKFKTWPKTNGSAWVLSVALIFTAILAAFAHQWASTIILSIISLVIIYNSLLKQSYSMKTMYAAFKMLLNAEKVETSQHLKEQAPLILNENGNGNSNGNGNGNGLVYTLKQNGNYKSKIESIEIQANPELQVPVTEGPKGNGSAGITTKS